MNGETEVFEIDLKSRKSIYEQVVGKLKERILVGLIAPDDKLPSVRDLSKTLTVNPNTVQKAFRELERQGFMYTVAGVGSFASLPEAAGQGSAVVAEVRTRLSGDLHELYYLTRDVGSVRRIVDEEIAGLPASASMVSRKESDI
jgi:GntR family transcriptional regulator